MNLASSGDGIFSFAIGYQSWQSDLAGHCIKKHRCCPLVAREFDLRRQQFHLHLQQHHHHHHHHHMEMIENHKMSDPNVNIFKKHYSFNHLASLRLPDLLVAASHFCVVARARTLMPHPCTAPQLLPTSTSCHKVHQTLLVKMEIM